MTDVVSMLPKYLRKVDVTLLKTRPISSTSILYYKIQSVCVCVSMYVRMLVRNRLQNHAHYSDEAFAGDSVGLGLGQRLNFI